MQKFQAAGDDQNRDRYDSGLILEDQKSEKAPEYLIKESAKGIVHPVRRGACIELAIKTDRNDEE